MSARLAIALLSAAMTFACGGSTIDDSSTGGSAGGGGSPGGGGGGSGGDGGGGFGGGGLGGGGTGGVSCASFADENPPGNVTVRYQNALSVPIYLGGGDTCDPDPIYDLQGPNGPVPMFAGGCGHTCEALQQHGDWCTDACMIPPVVMIAPGGSYDDSWSGASFVHENMPQSCYFEPQYAPPSCDRRVIAPAGSYAVMATAGTSLTCNDVGICACTPNAQGSCQIPYGAAPSGTPLAAKASFEMPGTSLVVITFQ